MIWSQTPIVSQGRPVRLRPRLEHRHASADASAAHGALSAHAGTLRVLDLEGVIGPTSAGFIDDGLAPAEGLAAVVIALDTPGGLDTTMRQIIKPLSGPTPGQLKVST